MTTSNLKIIDYINSLISLLPNSSEFKQYDFAILCEKYPILINKGTALARVLYISLTNSDKQTSRLYPNQLKEMNLDNVILTSNLRRRIMRIHKNFLLIEILKNKLSKNIHSIIIRLRRLTNQIRR